MRAAAKEFESLVAEQPQSYVHQEEVCLGEFRQPGR